MKRFIVTTIFETEDEKQIIETIDKEFQLEAGDLRDLLAGKEICTGTHKDDFGTMYMKIKIEGITQWQ